MVLTESSKRQRYYQTGGFMLVYANALRHFSGEHSHPFRVIAELVDNGRDAKARVIYIEVSPTKIRITDDGAGMLPYILDEDHAKFQQFLEEIERGQSPVDIRQKVAPISMRSLEWMAVNAAFSGKQFIDRTQRGEKAVGFQSTRSLGNHIVVRTRPSAELALACWGNSKFADSPPVYEYRAPTSEELDAYKVLVDIKSVHPTFKDPNGHELVQGTIVEITQIKEGVLQALRPSLLLQELQDRFGNDIANGMKIAVIDNLTEEGRKNKGLITYVKPASYRGTPIFIGNLELPKAGVTCHAAIYYTSGKNLTGVMLRRKGADVSELTALHDLKVVPFTTGNLIGYVEYPDDSRAEWDSKKTEPMMGPLRKEWTQVVKGKIPEIQKKIDALESRSRSAQLTEVSKQVGEAIIEALSRVEDFAPLTVQGGKEKTLKPDIVPGQTRVKDSTYVENRLLVRVEDEYRRPVEGVDLICTFSNGERVQKTTQLSGMVSFGKDLWKDYPEGDFSVEVIIPQGMESIDKVIEQTVRLSSSIPGCRLIFRVQTNRPGPKPLNIRQINPVPTENLGVIYSAEDLPYSGVVYIDQDLGEYGEAARTNNIDRIAELTALYMACAVVEVAYNHDKQYPDPAPYQLMKASELASVAMRIFRERFGRRRK